MTQAISPIDPSVREFLAAGTPKVQSSSRAGGNDIPSSDVSSTAPTPPPIQKAAAPAPRVSARGKDTPSKDPGPLVSVTFRVPQNISEAMMRAATDRKIRRIKPQSQQEIAAVALEEWLKSNEYM
jgi:hypothetical protein